WILVAAGVLLLARRALLSEPKNGLGVASARELLEALLVALVVVFLVLRPFVVQAYFIPSESMHPTLRESDRILVNKLAYRFGSPRRGEILVFRPPDHVEQKDYIKRVIGLPGERVEVVPQRLLVDGRILIRITRKSASEVAGENFGQGDVGFTYPTNGAGVYLEGDVAVLSSGYEHDLKVAAYGPDDVIEREGNYVYLNGKPLLAAVFGPITTSHSLIQWGGDPRLEGTVYSVNDDPRLILVRGKRLTLDAGHVLVDGRRQAEPYLAEEPAYALPPLTLGPRQYFLLGDNRNHSFDSHAWGPLSSERVIGRADLIFWPPDRFRLIHK
ncbi:MAG TPA: signal peptidase I, partial [Armatimonadota bacterium]|nr:signal peptidase I [Armatimonadota bacterium]